MSFRKNWIWIGLGLLALGVFISNEGVRSYFSRRREFHQVRKKLEEAQSRLAQKQDLLARSKNDDAFLEREARRSLGLVRGDEIEYRFPSAEKETR
ncbi:MAG: septum formation initiator family protein [Elusimicrobia bacterium]|nr:septum formation initiator family protein [Elusimicrobiota bacterium]